MFVGDQCRGFRDVVALARLRLAPQDPLISQCLLEWAHELESKQSYEEAAQWYVIVGRLV